MPKDEYHFIGEIHQQAHAIRDTLAAEADNLRVIAEALAGQVNRVIMVGCGDPYFAAHAAVYPLEAWARLPASAVAHWRDVNIHFAGLPDLLSSLVYVVPLQLFACHQVLVRKTNPDRPIGFDNVALQKLIYTGLLEGWQ